MTRSEEEIRVLYERLAPMLHRRARRLLGSEEEAWDAVHDVFVRLLGGGWRSFRGRATPLTYIYRITTNVCLNMLRARGASNRAYSKLANEPSLAVPAYDASEFLERLMAALSTQRDADRLLQVAVYKHVEDMTVAEIASVIGRGARTVKRGPRSTEATRAR